MPEPPDDYQLYGRTRAASDPTGAWDRPGRDEEGLDERRFAGPRVANEHDVANVSGLVGLPVYLHVDVDIMDSTEQPGLRFPAGPGPALGDVENCLDAITANADIVAACLACAWLPGQVGRPPAREAIARLAGALGTRLSWPPGDMQATAP